MSMKSFKELIEARKDGIEDEKLKIIRELIAENEYMRNEMQRMQSEHFRIHGNLTAEIRPLREALQALVSDLLPKSTTPTQMMSYNKPWQLTAQALYGITPNAKLPGGREAG